MSLEEKNIAIREAFKKITIPSASWNGLRAARKIAISVSYLLSQYARELAQYALEQRESQQITNTSFKELINSSGRASSFARIINQYSRELIQYAKELDKLEKSITRSSASASPLSSSDDSDSDESNSDSDESNSDSDESNSDSEFDF